MEENTVITFASAPDLKAKRHVKDAIRAQLCKPKVYSAIQPYITNGGKCGHKVMDYANVVIILKEADTDEAIAAFGLNDFKLSNAIKQVLRERLTLDKSWRVTGLRLAQAK